MLEQKDRSAQVTDHHMRPLAFVVGILIAVTIGGQALATPRDADVPLTYARNDWRMIGPSARTTQSKCVGDPKTPACAIETVLACLVRRDDHLCKIAQGPLLIYLTFDYAAPFMKYRIDSAKKVRPRDLGSRETPGYASREAGDIEVGIQFIDCTTATDCRKFCNAGACEPSFSGTTVLLRRTGNRWSVAALVGCYPQDIGRASACPSWHESP